MRSIAIVNQKGGCGKTTTAVNLAACLADKGKRVLLVDLDPQSHASMGLGIDTEDLVSSTYDLIMNPSTSVDGMVRTAGENLDVVPSNVVLSAVEQQLAGRQDRENRLRDKLEACRDRYDYVIVDCPPSVGLLTFNAIRAATDVIVPVETGYFALHGLSKQLETLSILCKRCNQQVNVYVLASMYDIRTKMAREILAELRRQFADKMFDTVVNFNTKIKEAASLGQPICEYDPVSKGNKDFRNLANEVIGSGAKHQRHEFVNSLAGQLEAISVTADELLQSARTPVREFKPAETKQTEMVPVVADIPEPEPEERQHSEDLDLKLADYYGVSQNNGAVAFVTLYPRAESVQIAGDFNNWQPEQTTLKKVGEDGVWQAQLKLPSGRYRYRLVVDGQWQQDPYNENTELNPFGELNSVVEVT